MSATFAYEPQKTPVHRTLDELVAHIDHGGGFLNRGKALVFVQRIWGEPDMCRWTWIVNDDGSRVREHDPEKPHTLSSVASMVHCGVDTTGCKWAFATVNVSYS